MKNILVLCSLLVISCTAKIDKNTVAIASIVGTLHDVHKLPNYTEKELKTILVKNNPDIVLLEYPQDWFDSSYIPLKNTLPFLTEEKYQNGGRDGQIGWNYCQTHNKKCIPYDISGRNDFFKKNDYHPRFKKFYNDLVPFLKTNPLLENLWDQADELNNFCQQGNPQIINSEACNRITKYYRDFRYKIHKALVTLKKTEDPDFFDLYWNYWDRRNSTMASNICAIANNHPGKKIIVLMGYQHKYALQALLDKCSSLSLRSFKLK